MDAGPKVPARRANAPDLQDRRADASDRPTLFSGNHGNLRAITARARMSRRGRGGTSFGLAWRDELFAANRRATPPRLLQMLPRHWARCAVLALAFTTSLKAVQLLRSLDLAPEKKVRAAVLLAADAGEADQHQLGWTGNEVVARQLNAAEPAAATTATAASAAAATPQTRLSSLPPCVRVYVYNASQLSERELRQKGFGSPLREQLVGAEGAGGLFNTEQHATGAILLSRLLRSKRCPIVSDPAAAQVFIVPMLAAPVDAALASGEGGVTFSFMPPSVRAALWPLCERLITENWTAVLPHFTPRTASRHVFLSDIFFALFNSCDGADPGFAFRLASNPAAHLLAQAVWTDETPSDGTMRGSGGGFSPSILNRMRKISIAYPSSVHLSGNWSANPLKPWRRRPLAERPYLMMFGGSMHGSPLAERLRKHIARMCEEYAARHGPLACKLVTAEHNFDAQLGVATQVMQQSRFCLEPPGFGDERKAIVDALTLGCIPVTFLPRVEADLWATHWSEGWRRESRLLLDHERVLAAPSPGPEGVVLLDIFSALSSVSDETVRSMQSSIEAHAHRLHCGLDEDPALEDSVDITLRAFAEQEGWAARGGAGESGGSEDAGACADGNWMANPAMQNRMGTASMPGRDCASIIGAVGCAAHVAPKHSSLLVSELCPKSCRRCT